MPFLDLPIILTKRICRALHLQTRALCISSAILKEESDILLSALRMLDEKTVPAPMSRCWIRNWSGLTQHKDWNGEETAGTV